MIMPWIYGGGFLVMLATFVADAWVHVDYWRAAAWSLTCGAVFVTVFTVLYGSLSNWRSNRIGKILFTKSILFTLMMWQITASTWTGSDYPFRNQIRFVLYAAFALAYATMVVALRQEQTKRES